MQMQVVGTGWGAPCGALPLVQQPSVSAREDPAQTFSKGPAGANGREWRPAVPSKFARPVTICRSPMVTDLIGAHDMQHPSLPRPWPAHDDGGCFSPRVDNRRRPISPGQFLQPRQTDLSYLLLVSPATPRNTIASV